MMTNTLVVMDQERLSNAPNRARKKAATKQAFPNSNGDENRINIGGKHAGATAAPPTPASTAKLKANVKEKAPGKRLEQNLPPAPVQSADVNANINMGTLLPVELPHQNAYLGLASAMQQELLFSSSIAMTANRALPTNVLGELMGQGSSSSTALRVDSISMDPSMMPSELGFPTGLPLATAPEGIAAAAIPMSYDEPIYVNPKQYHRILKRREQRGKQMGNMEFIQLPSSREKRYRYASRHKFAVSRQRGASGRFVSGGKKDSAKASEPNSDPTPPSSSKNNASHAEPSSESDLYDKAQLESDMDPGLTSLQASLKDYIETGSGSRPVRQETMEDLMNSPTAFKPSEPQQQGKKRGRPPP